MKLTTAKACAGVILAAGINAVALAPVAAADPNENCVVPTSLGDVIFLFEDDAPKSPQNPYAGTRWRMSFRSDGAYNYVVVNDGSQHAGTYTYQTTSPNVGVVTASEVFDGTPTRYTQTLTCTTNTTGTYLYVQTAGTEPAERSNTARYTIVSQPAA